MPADAMLLRSEFIGLNETVPVRDGRRLVYVNFDNAATTPPLKAVVDAVNTLLPGIPVSTGDLVTNPNSPPAFTTAPAIILRVFSGLIPERTW